VGILKNQTIKSVAKKWTRKLISILEKAEINSDEDIMEILKSYIKVTETIGQGTLAIKVDEVSHWYGLFLAIVFQAVRVELSYDPTIGNESDFEVTHKAVSKELSKWKKELQRSIDLYEVFSTENVKFFDR